jgi:toxin ParE1/3/4
MAARVLIRDQAFEDLASIAGYLAKSSLRASERFLAAADETFASLASSPKMGALCQFEHPFVADVRVWRIKGFEKYLVFYAPVAGGIRIYRVLHGSRDIEQALAEG